METAHDWVFSWCERFWGEDEGLDGLVIYNLVSRLGDVEVDILWKIHLSGEMDEIRFLICWISSPKLGKSFCTRASVEAQGYIL